MKNNDKIVKPDYNHSILNLITSILKYYGVKSEHDSLPILDSKLNEKKYKNIILIVLDGMGQYILNNLSRDGYFENNKIDNLTSVYPSTTTAALTTYYSGKPPYETGWIAWSQYFKEYGRCIDMLKHKESYFDEDLLHVKKDVFKEIVNYKSIFDLIEESGIKAYELMPSYSEKRAKRSVRADSIDEIADNIKLLAESKENKFIMAYSDNPDGLLHKYGASSEEARKFIIETEEKIKKLSEELSEDSLIIISADHGHKDIDKVYELDDYPEIRECLFMPESLESRCLTFWVKENMKKEFEDRFNNIFEKEFKLYTKENFLENHFLGYGKKHKKIDDFLGDYVAVSIGSSIIRISNYLFEGKNVKKSTHCGMTRDEMMVPLIIIK